MQHYSELRQCFDLSDCDKGDRHGYESIYEPIFEPRRHEKLRILEVGIFKGASIESWLQYFPNATITGIDTFQRVKAADIGILQHERVNWYAADSTDIVLLGEFDIIIDDGSHTFAAQKKTFECLINNCRWRYFIEDCWPMYIMTPKEKKNPWLKRTGFSEADYDALIETTMPYDPVLHTNREGHQPDSCIMEIRL